MIFLDGVGIGEDDPSINPFFKYGFNTFQKILGEIPSYKNPKLHKDDIYLFPVDAKLGVEGLPQSGTGQVSIYCGINAAKLLGRHLGPFTPTSLVTALQEKNIFREFLKRNKKAAFANAYPQAFFDYINSGRRRIGTASLSCLLSGVKLNGFEELKAGTALSPEIDNSRWVKRLNYDLPIITPEEAARNLLEIAYNNSFTLYEYFFTDHLGHGRNSEFLQEWLSTLDRFLYFLLTNFNRDKLEVIICSDHGNLENISVKMHTLNPALAITAGKNSGRLSEKIKDLTDIQPSILELFS